MKKVCVFGSGTMGSDIVQVFAMHDIDVVMKVRSEASRTRAMGKIEKSLDKLVSKEKITAEKKAAVMSKISTSFENKDFADCDLIIEAAVENEQEKKNLFKELDQICKPETIFATNTSSISITSIATATSRPDKFIGMHFFNPATVMKLVEIIRGLATSDETYKAIYDLTLQIEKEPVKVSEGPGFVVNRILIPMINEAATILADGIATADDIDKAMKLGANHPMGPLALGDLIGLDVCLSIMEVMFTETGDPKYRPSILLKKMVRGGKLGRKSGEGFFSYKK